MKPMHSDDWFEALAGRPRAGADPALVAEASLLREALQRWSSSSPTLTAAQAQAGKTALLAAARRDPRVIAQQGCSVCTGIRRLLAWPRLAGALVLTMLASMAILVMPGRDEIPTPADSETLRASPREGVQRFRASDPRALRDRIVSDLARAGVTAKTYERFGRQGLDAELPLPLTDDLASLLTRYGLAAPPSGGLAVELEPKAAP